MMSHQTLNYKAEPSYSEETATRRKPDYSVHPLFLNRWSPRSYSSLPVSEEVLYTVLEAARWAPSSGNQQPWRFYVASSHKEKELFLQFIKPRNRLWIEQAPVLIVIASASLKPDGEPNGSHAFDAGAAWASLAYQAHLLGLSTRAIGGFEREQARQLLQTPEEIELHAVIALGYRGSLETLDESFHEQEAPNGRRSLAESILKIPVI